MFACRKWSEYTGLLQLVYHGVGVNQAALDLVWMHAALNKARAAQLRGEVPVGAVLVSGAEKIAEVGNSSISLHDPSAHAEVLVLRAAGSILNNYRLPNTTLYVTLEPCIMCVGAMLHARITRLVFGAYDLKTGAVTSCFPMLADERHNHRIEWTGGVLQLESKTLLQSFFQTKRC